MTEHTLLSRRALLSAGVGAAAALPVLSLGTPVKANTPEVTSPFPSIYSRQFGGGQLLFIADGYVSLPTQVIVGLNEEEILSAQAAAYAPDPAMMDLAVNSQVLKLGDRTILIDAGAGVSLAPTMGRLPAALAAAGIAPESVTDVLVTHLHADHIGGLIPDGGPAFPNATVHMPEIERVFWADPSNASQVIEPARPWFDTASAVLAAYGDRVQTFTGEADILPGVRSLPMPGHSPGHGGFELSDGDDFLLICGDATILPAAFQFTHPAAFSVIDFDADQSIATRQALFDRAATDRILIAATHLAFPGVGHVETGPENTFAWVPEPWRLR